MSTSTNTLRQIPMSERYAPLQFITDENATTVRTEITYPINYEEVYNLKGRLLTLVDATFMDPAQRKAFKDITWATLREWMQDIATRGYTADDMGIALKLSENAGVEA